MPFCSGPKFPAFLLLGFVAAVLHHGVPVRAAESLDPAGKVHMPIGIANSLDTLKTFVEAEGCFSPGFGSYGIYFWVFDHQTGQLFAPPAGKCKWGLAEIRTVPPFGLANGRSAPRLRKPGYLIPWSFWETGHVEVFSQVCHVQRDSPEGKVHVVGASVQLNNCTTEPRNVSLYVALRPLGPAGFAVNEMSVSDSGQALLVDGRPALASDSPPSTAGVSDTDNVGTLARDGKIPAGRSAVSESGDCSGALRFDIILGGDGVHSVGLICPVLPGRRAARHDWDGTSNWAQIDLARPNPSSGGILQPDPGLAYYRRLKVGTLFAQARQYWASLVERARICVPDPRWGECFAAITAHAALEMNEGAPDVAVVNYNVFNRDGVYVANILQKSGNFRLAEQAIDYFLSHPFNGRVKVEADNPGQVLWAMGQHWLFSRDRVWLARTYPAAAKIAAMIRYYRTTPGPHYVKSNSLEFGDSLPPDRPAEPPSQRRQVLRPGCCDGHHPEYTEAFDIAGLRAARMLAEAAGREADALEWDTLAAKLMQKYDKQSGDQLAKGYGSCCVLWPCRLYPLGDGKACGQFKAVGAQKPNGWRYFALARAHQGLLAGNRESGYRTVNTHLDHPQMRGWYVFDEGGRSGSGGWGHVRTTWNSSVAMPHGWAIAELHLLLRNCLLYEEPERLVLFAGVPSEWFTGERPIRLTQMPTHFGTCSVEYQFDDGVGTMTIIGDAAPPEGFALALPASVPVTVTVGGEQIPRTSDGRYVLPPKTRQAQVRFEN
jgi:hypothetical protein